MEKQKTYRQLTLYEREQIDVLTRQGLSFSEIARRVGRDKGTVSRELKRNASQHYGCYLAGQAQQRSEKRKSTANRHERLKDLRITAYVRSKLIDEHLSPELIAGRLRIDIPGLSISHETIYRYIYAQDIEDRKELVKHLCRGHRKRRKRPLSRRLRRAKIPNRVPIDQRPQHIEARDQFGHWESDSLVSRASRSTLNSLTERKSRLLFITRLDGKGARETAEAIINRLGKLDSDARRTITMDNGTENAFHERVTAAIGARCYFAHPYASYERGTNEHINGLIRRYLPKGTDFSKITDAQLAWIEYRINSRPRKCLGFRTPLEIASLHGVALRC